MYAYGKVSEAHIATLHPDLQRLLREVIKYVNISVTCGHRGEAAQEAAFYSGASEVHWPDGMHNKLPSLAVDVAPYPLDWHDEESFTLLAGIIKGIAFMLGIKIRLGIDWDGDMVVREHKFKDRPHIELVLP
jgi:hypothetical protein